jgi:hypothetical protein
VNYGDAVLEDGSLKIVPQLTKITPGSIRIATEFVPVRWGSQRFLIPRERMMVFVYAVNSRSIAEIESFLMRIDDYGKERNGLPAVPTEYASYLRMKPIIGTISGFGPKPERWYPMILLNVGKSHGVIPEMKFYLSRRGNQFLILQVISVQERSSEASVVLASQAENGKDILPRVGWKFSSRAPKDSWQFMP